MEDRRRSLTSFSWARKDERFLQSSPGSAVWLCDGALVSPSVSETLHSIPTLQERRWEERNSPFPYRTHSNYQKTPLLIKSEPAILELSIAGCDPVLQI